MTAHPAGDSAEVERAKSCRYCGGAKRFQVVSIVSDHAWADCFCTRPALTSGSSAGEVQRLREALEASDYLASLYERLWKGGVVRDHAEAIAARDHTRTALRSVDGEAGRG